MKEIEKKRQEFLNNKPVKEQTRKRSRSRSYERHHRNRRDDDPRDGRRRDERPDARHENGKGKEAALDTSDKDSKYLIDQKEVEIIKAKHLGLIKEKKKMIKPSDKFKQVFLFDWDASEDTSKDINPLYNQRHEPKLLYGKGHMGGIDPEETRKGPGKDRSKE